MNEWLVKVLNNQGLILQVISGLLMDNDQRKMILDYGTELANMKPEQQDEQSGD